ncbi:MAG: ABC transporter ATP-binding protein [Candidatus Cloacimonetes bacterium]|nr:ABC transporter ATP-binding protein [Candidatus Cloacimonadota bacterium]
MIRAHKLVKKYLRGSEEIMAVNGIDIAIQTGEFIAFIGASGSGKTTLLHMLGCLDNPSAGELYVGGETVYKDNFRLPERKLTHIRRRTFGYIFQKFYLIPTLTVLENILLPHTFTQRRDNRNKVMEVTKLLGLDHRLMHLPKEISGGEMQRVAIARAMINEPKVILADEPTGNLDTKRSEEIAGILTQLNQEKGITIILVTHNPSIAQKAGRIVELRDGQLI